MMTRRHTLRSLALPARRAFTLIELLVVISIIAVLVALTATAAFGVRRNMQKQNAEVTLQKLDQKVQQKVKTIRDQIKDDTGKNTAEYNSALALVGNNPDGAKSIMLYGRLKKEFPMSFTEAKTPFTVGAYQYPASPTFNGLPATAGSTTEQAAACLYAALAPMGLEGLENQVGISPSGYKVFVDGFGTPITFVRLAFDGNLNELNTPPQTTAANRDPFDLEGKPATVVALTALWPTLNCPTLSDGGAYPTAATYRATNRNHVIALISAGPNKLFAEPTIFDGDNLLSYRLRKEGGKGD